MQEINEIFQEKAEVVHSFRFLKGMNVIWKTLFSFEKKGIFFFCNIFLYLFLKNESTLPALFLVMLIHPNVSSSYTVNTSTHFKKSLILHNGTVR